MIVTVKRLFFIPQRSKIFIFVSFYLCISRYGAFFRRRTFLKFVTMKSYLGVFLLFLVCLQASQVFGARIKRSPVPVAEEECTRPDFEDECDFDDPCGEIISPCGGKKCYPCSGCNSYICNPLSGE